MSKEVPAKSFIDTKNWKFYAAIVAGLALAGTGVFLLSSNYSYLQQQSNRVKREALSSRDHTGADTPEVFTAEMYESMTDAIVAVMSAEQRLAASNLLKVRGNTAFTNKQYNDAIRYYTQAIRFKADPIFFSNRAACYANLGNHNDKVIEDCNEALLLEPTYTKALHRRAQALERKGDLKEALFDYTSVCILEGFKNENAAKSMEKILKKISELKAKELIKTRKPRLPSPTFVTAYLESFHLDSNNDIPSTIYEDSGDAHYAKARRSLAEKQYYDAMDEVCLAVSVGCSAKYQPYALNLKGTMTFLKGDAQEALNIFNQSINLDPTYVQNYIKCSSIYMEQGNLENALQMFEKAIKLNPLDSDIYYHRGQVYFISGHFAEALENYKKSITLNPTFIFAHIQLAVVQYRMERVEDSMATLRAAVEKFPLSSDVHNYYGEIMAAQNKQREALELFNKAMSLDPNNPLPYINKAMVVYQSVNGVEEAISLCKSALEADPACDAAVASLAQMLLEQDRQNEALTYYQQAVDLARTETELALAISYVEATKVQIKFAKQYSKSAVPK